MEIAHKFLQAIRIPYAALISVIFGLMLLSFPIGAYIVFDSEIDEKINYEFPMQGLDLFLGGISLTLPIEFQLGDVFIIFWCVYGIFFSIAMIGPRKTIFHSISSIVAEGKEESSNNYLVATIKWFSIIILISGVINFIQESFGIITIPPIEDNKLVLFFDVMKAPLIEEIAFRVLLVGLPIYAIYSHKSTIKHLVKSLWRPHSNLHVFSKKRVIILISIVSIFFGLAHVISGEPWSAGKITQATASGMILGWVYFRYGFLPAVLIHWSSNFFVFAYVFAVAELNKISIENAFTHNLVNTLEILFLITGLIAMSLIVIKNLNSKKENNVKI